MQTSRAPRSVVWAKIVAGATVVLALGGTVLLLLAGHLVDSAKDLTDQWFGGLGLVAICLALTGGLIAVRRPGNRIGWLLLVPGLCYGAIQLGSGYGQGVTYAGWPAIHVLWPVAWLIMWSWAPALACVGVLLPLLFPTGRLPSRRWRPVAVFTFSSVATFTVGAAIATVPATDALFRGETGEVPVPGWLDPWFTAATLMAGVSLFMCLASVFFRFHRARGVERQQLKWFAAGGVFVALAILASFLTEWWTALLALLGLFLFIACIGVAILRYRLYDIDRIVSRVLSYAVVTAVLVGVYTGVVVGLGSALGRIGNPVLIAGGTLLVAALFGPVRRKVQSVVDRRFNRRRYDAEHTLAAFSARLRDEVDIAELRTGLLSAVSDAVEPSSAGLWLRGATP